MEAKLLKIAHHTVTLTLKVVPDWGKREEIGKRERKKGRDE